MATKGIDVDADIAGLDESSKDDLVQRFGQLYGRPPPRYIHRALLLRAVAHRIQENAQGGPDPALRRRLARLAGELRRTGRIAVGTRPPVKPGTRLMREWQGEAVAGTTRQRQRHVMLSPASPGRRRTGSACR